MVMIFQVLSYFLLNTIQHLSKGRFPKLCNMIKLCSDFQQSSVSAVSLWHLKHSYMGTNLGVWKVPRILVLFPNPLDPGSLLTNSAPT